MPRISSAKGVALKCKHGFVHDLMMSFENNKTDVSNMLNAALGFVILASWESLSKESLQESGIKLLCHTEFSSVRLVDKFLKEHVDLQSASHVLNLPYAPEPSQPSYDLNVYTAAIEKFKTTENPNAVVFHVCIKDGASIMHKVDLNDTRRILG